MRIRWSEKNHITHRILCSIDTSMTYPEQGHPENQARHRNLIQRARQGKLGTLPSRPTMRQFLLVFLFVCCCGFPTGRRMEGELLVRNTIDDKTMKSE